MRSQTLLAFFALLARLAHFALCTLVAAEARGDSCPTPVHAGLDRVTLHPKTTTARTQLVSALRLSPCPARTLFAYRHDRDTPWLCVTLSSRGLVSGTVDRTAAVVHSAVDGVLARMPEVLEPTLKYHAYASDPEREWEHEHDDRTREKMGRACVHAYLPSIVDHPNTNNIAQATSLLVQHCRCSATLLFREGASLRQAKRRIRNPVQWRRYLTMCHPELPHHTNGPDTSVVQR
ncbi:MAG: hypothetical protein AAF525_14160 [Pseudomonadota bacterium]